MGQTNSRHHAPSTEPENPAPISSSTAIPVAGASTDSHSNPSADADLSTPDGPGSRRSSLRKSILKYVKPSSVRNRLGGVISHQPKEAGRRSSKHCSELPHDPITSPSDATLESTSDGTAENSTNLSTSHKGKQRETGLPDDGEASPTDSVVDADQALPIPDTISLPEQNLTDTTPVPVGPYAADDAPLDPLSVDDSSCPDSQIPHESESASASQGSPSPAEHPQESSESEAESQPPFSPRQSDDPQARPFPPPGTLVVVQGIVHTTDVSRNGSDPSAAPSSQENTILTPSNSSAQSGVESPEQIGSRARNRLSALLRPRTASSRPRPASTNDSLPVVAEAGPPESESVRVSPSASQASQIGSSYVTSDTGEPPVSSSSESVSNGNLALATESRAPSISSSSIDVLGTLLSVAAAATAASLLTGSSEPILSSGLTPPGSNPPIPSVSPLSSPAIPTALPNLPPYPSPPHNAGNPDLSAAGRAERLRQAWSTIRERLGLRPSAPSQGTDNMNGSASDAGEYGSTSSLPNGGSVASGTPTDTRELMLAEMARAFNIGLGLNGLSNLTPNAGVRTPDNRDAPSTPQDDSVENDSSSNWSEGDNGARTRAGNDNSTIAMPPEGSFERFLVDLQIDLRAALTQSEDEIDNDQNRPREFRDSLPPSTSTAIRTSDNDNPSSATAPSLTPERQAGGIEIPVTADPDPFAEMPPLQEVSDSESESEENDHEVAIGDNDEIRFGDPGFSEAAGPSSTSEGPGQTHPPGSGHIDASGRINWWRLYRFPAVPPPRTGPRQPTSLSASPLGPISFSNSPPAEAISADQPSANASASDPTSSSPPPSQPPSLSEGQTSTGDTSQIPLHSVVPVIVVGLQSVNQAWQHDIPPHPTHEGLDFVGQPGIEDPVSGAANGGVDHDEQDGLSALHGDLNASQASGDGERTPRRARNWHSRAANAIRNLRSGRRNVEAGTGGIHVPLVAPGSRTFFIYVIGGYYPPDHSIVTGGPNILDSFEALLELADLLGQVKPPTVSKEDIENSGLRIVEASQLEQLEKQGEVASNCLDRCLICLDDYAAEDPIRVMSCRHAFHKGCVDEWLQKGRNNCPACRSTGVSTDSHSASSMPTPAS